MVFVFGMDVPLVEMFVLMSLLIIVCIIMLVIMIKKQGDLRRKLDLMLAEEHEIKEELDLTKMEEDKQLMLMKRLVKELGKLHLISGKKEGEMTRLVDISRTATSLSPGQIDQQARIMQQMIAHVNNINSTVERESQQLEYITSLLEKEDAQQATQLRKQLTNQNAEF